MYVLVKWELIAHATRTEQATFRLYFSRMEAWARHLRFALTLTKMSTQALGYAIASWLNAPMLFFVKSLL